MVGQQSIRDPMGDLLCGLDDRRSAHAGSDMTPDARSPRTAPLQHWPVHTLPLPCHECGEGLNDLEAIRFRAAHDNTMGQQQADRDWLLRRLEVQAAPPDALREALTDSETGETVQDVLRWYAGKVAWPHSGYDPGPLVLEWADRIDAALAAPTARGVSEFYADPDNWTEDTAAIAALAAPATLPAIDTRIVWQRDHGMVIVTGDEEPQSLEIPAWAVRTIFDVAGKDPEEEARKVSAFINAYTGLDVKRLARLLHVTVCLSHADKHHVGQGSHCRLAAVIAGAWAEQGDAGERA